MVATIDQSDFCVAVSQCLGSRDPREATTDNDDARSHRTIGGGGYLRWGHDCGFTHLPLCCWRWRGAVSEACLGARRSRDRQPALTVFAGVADPLSTFVRSLISSSSISSRSAASSSTE